MGFGYEKLATPCVRTNHNITVGIDPDPDTDPDTDGNQEQTDRQLLAPGRG
jgi:hypothetical protein